MPNYLNQLINDIEAVKVVMRLRTECRQARGESVPRSPGHSKRKQNTENILFPQIQIRSAKMIHVIPRVLRSEIRAVIWTRISEDPLESGVHRYGYRKKCGLTVFLATHRMPHRLSLLRS